MNRPRQDHRFALADCNNFYAACERLFRPALAGQPVVVLSNNDGCIIARSSEAKALGIPMGAPLFQWRELLERHRVEICSANFALYGDLSRRVMQTLQQFTPEMEIYSIDEAFLMLDSFRHLNLSHYCRHMRATVLQWTGIPLSIGIGPSKTLAKLAAGIAKQTPGSHGVFDLCPSERRRTVLQRTPVDDVWGVGRRQGRKLRQHGIHTAWHLSRADPQTIRRRYGLALARTVRELAGESCLPLEAQPAPRRQIVSSRTFGHRLTALAPIRQAISHHTRLACDKLRRQGSRASTIAVLLLTSPHGPTPGQGGQHTLHLPRPSQDTALLTRLAQQALERLYRPGLVYHKCGVMLLDLDETGLQQGELFPQAVAESSEDPKRTRLMQAMDRINHRYGRGTLRLAREGFAGTGWGMRQQYRSPCYTTRWSDLPQVK